MSQNRVATGLCWIILFASIFTATYLLWGSTLWPGHLSKTNATMIADYVAEHRGGVRPTDYERHAISKGASWVVYYYPKTVGVSFGLDRDFSITVSKVTGDSVIRGERQ